jgi:hypothetical protein
MSDASFPFSTAQLAEVARKGLGLLDTTDISVGEVTGLGNMNHVFRVVADGHCSYLKAVTGRPKLLPVDLPRERIFFEAEAIGRFRAVCGPTVQVPEVLYLDRQAYALGMSDVGAGKRPLLEVIDEQYGLLVTHAPALGSALGHVHARSRGAAPFRPQHFERLLQMVIVEKLLAPGARALFEPQWPAIAAQMQGNNECLVHGDLWAKNLLVGVDAPPAIVDFEGAAIGDPAFDVATLLAVGVIPALKNPRLLDACVEYALVLVDAYRTAARQDLWTRDRTWPAAVCTRAFLYVGTLLAARGFGPFAYPMPEAAALRLARLARSLSVQPAADLMQYAERLVEHIGVTALAA